MNRTGLSFCLAVLAVAALGAAGCSSDKNQPPPQQPQPYAGGYQAGYPQQQPGYPQQQPGYPQQQPGYPQQQPGQPGYPQQQPGQPGYPPQPGQPGQPAPGQPGQPAPGQPGALPIPGFPGAPAGGGSGAAGGTAQPMDPNLAALATGPLGIYANSEAPGMQKEGPIVAGNFQEGQTLEGSFQFQPGRCYTLVAQGVGIQELDLEMQYVTPIPGIAPSIGTDKQRGAQASIGGRGQCLKPLSPFPAQAKFIVKATKGAGMAAAQLYAK